MNTNPYAVTEITAEESDAELDDDSQSVRRQYLAHEIAVQSVGLLYFFMAFLTIVTATGMLVASLSMTFHPDVLKQSDWLAEPVFGCFVLGIGLMQVFAGWSLRSLNDFGRPVAVLFACIGLLAIPIGTLISIYILYLLTSKAGDVVFSKEYQKTMLATQDIRNSNFILPWILILLLTGQSLGLIGLASFLRF